VLGHIDAIGVDEIQYQRSQLLDSGLSDRSRRHPPALGGPREPSNPFGDFSPSSATNWLRRLCSSAPMWEPYLTVIREKCSEALHILDRFHIVAKMNKALNEIRAGKSRCIARALAAAQTRRESEDGTALPVARSAPLQPEDRTCLPS
jgi:transposase